MIRIEFTVGAVIPDKGRIDGRKAGEVCDVLVGERLECSVRRARGMGTGDEQHQRRDEGDRFHVNSSAGYLGS